MKYGNKSIMNAYIPAPILNHGPIHWLSKLVCFPYHIITGRPKIVIIFPFSKMHYSKQNVSRFKMRISTMDLSNVIQAIGNKISQTYWKGLPIINMTQGQMTPSDQVIKKPSQFKEALVFFSGETINNDGLL